MNLNVNIKSDQPKCLKLSNYSNFYLSELHLGGQKQACKYSPYENSNRVNLSLKNKHIRSKTDHTRTLSDASMGQNNNKVSSRQNIKLNSTHRCQTLTLIPKSVSQKSHICKSNKQKSKQKNVNKNMFNSNIRKNVNPQQKYLSQSLVLNNLKSKFKNKEQNKKHAVHKIINMKLAEDNLFDSKNYRIRILEQNQQKLQQLKWLISSKIVKQLQKSKCNNKSFIHSSALEIYQSLKDETIMQGFKNKEFILIHFLNSELNNNLNKIDLLSQKAQQSHVLTARTFKNLQQQSQKHTKYKYQQSTKLLTMMKQYKDITNLLLPYLEKGLDLQVKQRKMVQLFKIQNKKNIKLMKFVNLMALKGIDVQNQLRSIQQ